MYSSQEESHRAKEICLLSIYIGNLLEDTRMSENKSKVSNFVHRKEIERKGKR